MMPDVKLGTHKIGTYYVCHQQVCILARLLFGNAATKQSFNKIIKKLVWKGVWQQEWLKWCNSYCDKF